MKNKVYIIAEIGINHNGDIDLAKKLIDKAHGSGCNAVKLQKRTIDLVYTEEELNKPRQSPWGTTTREQKEGLEFSIEQYVELEKYTKEKGLEFIVSCWDENSVELIEKNCNVDYHKVASALLTDKSFLKKLNECEKPIILSTGMSNEEEVEAALKVLDNVEFILACTSAYPTPDEQVNLSYIKTLKQKYPTMKVGFSNHSNGLLATHGAIAFGAECIEFHITHDRAAYGSDQAASIENSDELVSGIRKMRKLIGDGNKKIYDTELPIIEKLRKVNDILN
jgi:N-acetylneuraminate synthase